MTEGPQFAPVAAVAVILVRPDGSVLAQHRDEHALISPNQWGLVGGVQEEGEEPLAAAHRELLEETSLVPGELSLFFRGSRPASSGPGRTFWHVYGAPTVLTNDDIVVGEGRDIRFVSPKQLLASDLGASAAFFLPLFLRSPDYLACRSNRGLAQ